MSLCRARGETPRLIFGMGRIPFVDRRVSRPELAELKETGALPFMQIPLLEVTCADGSVVSFAQSHAIMAFLAKLTGLYPSDPLAAARAEERLCAAEELTSVNPVVHVFEGDLRASKLADFMAMAPAKLSNLARHVAAHPMPVVEGTPSADEGGVTHGDLYLFQVLCAVLEAAPEALDGEATAPLRDFMARMRCHARLKQLLERRPGPGFNSKPKPAAAGGGGGAGSSSGGGK